MWGVGGIFLTQLPPIANVYESVFPSRLITFRFTNLKKAPRPKKATMLPTNPSKPVPKGTHDQVRALKDLDPDNTDDNAFKLVTHIIDFLPILLVVKLSYKIMFSRVVAPLFVSDNPQIIQYGVPVREAMDITGETCTARGTIVQIQQI